MSNYRKCCALPFVACSSLQCTNMSLQIRQIQSHGITHESVSPTGIHLDIRGVELLLWHLSCLSFCQSPSIPSQCHISLFQISTPIQSILTEVPCWFLSLTRNLLRKWAHHKQRQDRFSVHPVMIFPITPPTDSAAKYNDHEKINKYSMHT